MSAVAIAQLFPVFYMPKEEPVFETYMWLKEATKQPQESITKNEKLNIDKIDNHHNTPVTIPTGVVEPVKRVDQDRQNKERDKERDRERGRYVPTPNKAVARTVAKPYQSLLSLIVDESSPIRNINDEVKERHKIAVFFGESKQNRALLKTSCSMRITLKEMDEIISDIMTVSLTDNSRKGEGLTSCFGRVFMNLGILVAYAQYYKKAIVLLHPERRTRLTFGKEFLQENVSYISFDPVANTFGPFLSDSPETLFELVHWQKPLKAISNYTLSELIADCEKVGIGLSPLVKYKKADLYTMLENHCYGL